MFSEPSLQAKWKIKPLAGKLELVKEAEDARVSEVTVDFNLAFNVFFYPFISASVFTKYLKSIDVAGLLLSCKTNVNSNNPRYNFEYTGGV
jgi:hypothetical protein